MPVQLLTAPSSEPITRTEAKLHCKVDITDDDTLIDDLIAAARQDAEHETRRALITQQWRLTLDDWSGRTRVERAGYAPYPWQCDVDLWQCGGLRNIIRVPFPPLASVQSIKYYDTAGVQQTLDPTAYIVDVASEPGRITPAYGTTWPVAQARINAIAIEFTCGVDSLATVPYGLGVKRWVKLRVATLYEHREEVALLNRGTIQYLPYVNRLLDRALVYA